MTTSKLDKYWVLIAILLITVIAVAGIVACSKYGRSLPIEISTPPQGELQGEIYVGGAVCNPGFYPIKAGDTLETVIQAAGGTTGSADFANIQIYVYRAGEESQPQKIDLNRAEAWLLEALPGIGETKAQAIINYRQQNGLFKNINELNEVEGIGVATCERIAHLITVSD